MAGNFGGSAECAQKKIPQSAPSLVSPSHDCFHTFLAMLCRGTPIQPRDLRFGLIRAVGREDNGGGELISIENKDLGLSLLL